jgi:hypothetical protein
MRGQDLHSDGLVECGVHCLVDGSHAALAQLEQEPILTEHTQFLGVATRIGTFALSGTRSTLADRSGPRQRNLELGFSRAPI